MESPRRTKMKKVYVHIHRTVCYILWSINLTYLTTKYFAYDTEVDHGFSTPVTLAQPNLSLCFDLNTILGGHEMLIFNDHTPQFLGLTSREIFDRVPPVNQVLKRCAFRDPMSDQIIQVENSTECYQLFTIKRYRMHCFICYLFYVNARHNFSFNALAFSLDEPKLLYNVAVERPLTKGHSVAPLVHFDPLADADRMYMKELFPSKKKKELYHLEYVLYEIERLPRPYDTKCGPEPQLRCLHNCYGREYPKYGFTLANSVVREAPETSSSKVFNFNGSREQTTLRNKVYLLCSELCTSEACSQKLVVTHPFGPFKSEHKLSFNVGSYREPIQLMKYSPKLSLADHMTQSLSLSGIWVGFSVVALIARRKRFNIITTYKTWVALRAKLLSRNRVAPARIEQVNKKDRREKGPKTGQFLRVRRLLSAAFKFATLLIFTFQALNLCFIYTEYKTILKYHHSLNPEFTFRLPSTVICLDIDDLLPSDTHSSVTERNYEDVLINKSTWVNMTLEQIFNNTIGEDFLFKCRVKSYDWKDYFKGQFKLKPASECLRDDFTFHKYFAKLQMCYLFKPRLLTKNVPKNFRQHHLTFGAINPSRLYSLILNPKIKHFGELDLTVYFDSRNMSYVSSEFRAFSPNLAEKRVVILTFSTILFNSLPAPYDTRCDSHSLQSECRNRCWTSGLAHLDRVPYTNRVKEKSKKRLVSFRDLRDQRTNELHSQVENYCNERCKFSACSGNYTLTYSRHAIGPSEFDVEVVLSPEANPRIHALSVPRFELHDFSYQIFCLLAFWLGFSFVGLDFIHNVNERRFKEAAKVLHSESKTLLLSLRSFQVKINHSKANALRRNLLMKRVICYSTCVLGVCLHLVLPISDYLAYPTKLLTTISYEETIPCKLIVCSEAQDLFERGLLFEGNKKTKGEYLFDRNLDEIMSEVKKLNNSMSACGYWGLSRDKNETNEMKKATDRVFFGSNNSSLCDEMLYSRIFIRQGHVCFEYRLRRRTVWNRSQMLGSINAVKTVLSVSVNSSAISQRFTVIAHFYKPLNEPFQTSIWGRSVLAQLVDYRFIVSYSTFALQMLPFPYSEKGFVPSHISNCITQCLNGRIRRFNFARIAFGEKMPPYKLLSKLQRKNNLVGQLTCEMEKECDKKCFIKNPFRGMKAFYMVTTISEPLPNEGVQKGLTRFDLRRTDDPVITMKFLVSISIFDLIINIGSVISIWFGLSVINIPNLASQEDMEKLYIRTVDNLKGTNFILRRTNSRSIIRVQ